MSNLSILDRNIIHSFGDSELTEIMYLRFRHSFGSLKSEELTYKYSPWTIEVLLTKTYELNKEFYDKISDNKNVKEVLKDLGEYMIERSYQLEKKNGN